MTSRTDGGARPRALVVGTGLIGGSIALSLRRARLARQPGSTPTLQRTAEALSTGVIDQAGDDLEAEIVFVATPADGGGRGGRPDPGHAAAPRTMRW